MRDHILCVAPREPAVSTRSSVRLEHGESHAGGFPVARPREGVIGRARRTAVGSTGGAPPLNRPREIRRRGAETSLGVVPAPRGREGTHPNRHLGGASMRTRIGTKRSNGRRPAPPAGLDRTCLGNTDLDEPAPGSTEHAVGPHRQRTDHRPRHSHPNPDRLDANRTALRRQRQPETTRPDPGTTEPPGLGPAGRPLGPTAAINPPSPLPCGG